MAEIALPMTLPPTRARVGRLAEAMALGLILLFALRLRVWNLDAYTGSFDEGIRSQQLLLMAHGYRPFKDIFSSQGPLLLDVLYPFFALFGQTLEAARAGVVLLSMVGLVGAWWVGRLVAGPIAGVASAALLALSPGYLEGSRLALAEVPTIAPALLAIGAALAYRRSGARGWLVASATLCALALLIKPMVVHVGVPLLALLAMGGPPNVRGAARWRHGALDLGVYAAVVAVLCGIVIAALGPAEVWDNLGAYRSGAGAGVGGGLGSDWAENLRLTRNVMGRERAGLFALAAVGLVLGVWRWPSQVLPMGLWAGGVAAMFFLYGDLADKHIVYLIPPLALLGGVGVGATWRAPLVILSAAKDLMLTGTDVARSMRSYAALRMTRGARRTTDEGRWTATEAPWTAPEAPWTAPEGRRTGPGGRRTARGPWLGLLLGLAALGLYLWNVPTLYRADIDVIVEAEQVAERRRGLAAELDMAEVIRTRVEPGGWVLADNPNAAFRASRLVIPSLVDTSGTRVDARSLTDAVAIDAVERYRPAVIVTWSRRLGRLDGLTRWLPENGYALDRTYDGGWKLYVSGP